MARREEVELALLSRLARRSLSELALPENERQFGRELCEALDEVAGLRSRLGGVRLDVRLYEEEGLDEATLRALMALGYAGY